ncbi:MAG: RNA polymerase factor sigma-54 [Methylotenera sp.]|nr:RNA polymerase factor sigma-54 [Methylotenera sp.]MDO9388417.1 RNA polymerase factor sigma-54 [Methylotenera sp.]MDP2102441.1 RNA polymerase factor sigma-54 [Methylotenera sp.]MDP2281676.1 RNA polymerase factor sigma-54 [Methylotenera sp.]MDP3060871.1 RNA polymerase factor sigma-54 [Methylotenera sp.]
MKQGLQLRFSQNLSLTPQLQQAIRLLQLSTLELNQEIDVLMQTNPLLERGDDNEDEYGNPTESVSESGSLAADNNSVDAAQDDRNKQEDHAADLDAPAADFEFNAAESAMSASNPLELSQPNEASEFEASTEFPDTYSAEFNDEFDEFSNGSRWDENTSPADDDSDYKPQETLQISLREHLLSQLKLMPLSERDQSLTMLLVDSINEDGYLEASLESLAEQMPLELEIDALELQTALHYVQHLDPLGVGARNLSECLLLQLQALPEETPHLALAQLVAKHYLPALGARDFVKLRKELGCDEVTLKHVQQLITSLNPRPGSAFTLIGSEHYIQHEVIVKKVKGIWIASLNDGVIPKLKINQLYAGILKRNRDSSSQYLQSQMQEAKWMIKNIQQRFSTILRVSQAIVDRQRNFLEYGEVAMRPLVLREIADELDLHESTISRVTTSKYMLTPRGLFELKYFFGSSVATDSGGTCSATAIRALIKQLVEQENPKKPYSDNQITALLSKQGIVVARRTIAKYRESLNVAPASLRKSL